MCFVSILHASELQTRTYHRRAFVGAARGMHADFSGMAKPSGQNLRLKVTSHLRLRVYGLRFGV